MAEARSNTHNKRSLIRTPHICHRRRATGRNEQVEEYKNTHTHTQMLVTGKLNGRKYIVFRGFVCDIIRPRKKLPVQS